jgi:hypothetical protein
MNGKTVLEPKLPATQTAESVKHLIEFVSGNPCQELPAVFKLTNGVQLTRSSKGDAYYVTSKQGCTCSGYTYRRTCRHVTALEDGKPSQAELYQRRQRELRAKATAGLIEPVDSIKPAYEKFAPCLE